ncbi:DUF2793 domain-containing protein [Tardiphaga sp. 172_B4_N1_3]|uniref:DUF2793 domain-containing protein n=1 Tax=Tardiphaga sp. 172_B4_N1_3 TaxID=3240787 RepID=UPI003F8AEF41
MTDTPNLKLPFIESGQAQKHVTHNEALRILDAAIQISVLDVTRTVPPASPGEGARHIVAAGASGAWSGHALAIATWQDGTWAFLVPKAGWCVWSVADDVMMVFDGALWRAVGSPSLDSVPHLGINISADSSNLLSVKSNAALFAAIGAADAGTGDMRVQVSKDSAARAASVVFSDAYSGRAEFGLIGSDAFKLKVSPDGSGWVEALVVDPASGNATLPRGLLLTGVVAPAEITANVNDYSPAGVAGAAVLQLSADAARSVSGLAGGSEGRIVSLINVGGQPITLLDDSAASAAANRFAFGGHLTLMAKQGALLRYNGTAARWQSISGGTSIRADSAQSLTAAQQAQARANAGVLGRNRILNGQFAINQRGAGGGVTDNAYSADRWRMIGEFTSATIFADNFNAAGGNVPGAVFQFSGTTDKGGFFQIIEGRNCKDLRGKAVTLSMLMQVSSMRLGNMKIGILEWTGAEDATSGDPVASWGADGVTPTLAANWAFRNAPVNLGVTTSSAQYSATVTLGSSFNNIAVMIWNDDKSYTASDNFGVTNVQLEEGGVATTYDQQMYEREVRLCEYYCRSLGSKGVVSYDLVAAGYVSSPTLFYANYLFPRMRSVPIPTFQAAANYIAATAAGLFPGSAISTATSSEVAIQIALTVSGATAGQAGNLQANGAAIARIILNAEI